MHILSALWIHGEILTVGTFFPVPYSLRSSLSAAYGLYEENQTLMGVILPLERVRTVLLLTVFPRSTKDLDRILPVYEW